MRHYFNIFVLLLSIISCNKVFATEPSNPPNNRNFKNLHIINHPLIEDRLTLMRKKDTKTFEFRKALREIAMLMSFEVTKSMETEDINIETPVASMVGAQLKQKVVIVPILRAGLGMAEGVEALIPDAAVAHIGLYRDPQTKTAVEYYFKIPPIDDQLFIVVDPMLATGNTAIYAVQKLLSSGVRPEQIVFMALVVAPEGVAKFESSHPTIQIYVASLDKKLNDHAYIVPGLGDAGDRIFGTK